MKVLFLDIDGVLSLYGTGSKTFGLNKKRIQLLKNIVVQTGCRIVLSSTWRLHASAMRKLLTAFKYTGLSIYSMTDNLEGKFSTSQECRAAEIQLWLARHPDTTNYAVVDDMLLPIQNFFKTDPTEGLTPIIANNIIDHLRPI